MQVHIAELAKLFNTYATLLEIQGANPFRVRAYRRAAQTVQSLPQGIAAMLAQGQDLAELPGIGKDLAGKIGDIVSTGKFAALEELESTLPPALVELATIPGLGPKRIGLLHAKLGIKTREDLRRALDSGRLQELRGFGPKLEQSIAEHLKAAPAAPARSKLADVEDVASALLVHLKAVPGVLAADIAGSYRRRRDTVGDLDIVVAARRGAKVMDAFIGYDGVAEVLVKGPTRATVALRSGMLVDLRLVPQASYGAALYHLTGSKDHNVAVRKIAVARHLKINEYGVFRGRRRIAGRTEQEVFACVGLPYIEPELRENQGEIEAALAGRLPQLVQLRDIRGDLHAHGKATDGRHSIEEMAQAARERGYAYVAITDHSQQVRVARGLDVRRLHAQLREIDRLNATLSGFTVLKGIEVDILEDGSLGLPDKVLQELDVVVGAVHAGLDLPEKKQTARVLRAIDNPRLHVLAHLTGRLIGEREPCALDVPRIIAAARAGGCILEVNAQPSRMDLNDVYCRMAKEAGVKLAISTDAHSMLSLGYMRLGVDQARRGWLEPADVVNTRPLAELRALLKR